MSPHALFTNMFKMKLRYRLAAGFTVLILLMAIQAVYFSFQSRDLAQKSSNLFNHPYQVSTGLLAINRDIYDIDRRVKDLIMQGGSANNSDILNEIDALIQTTTTNFELLFERKLGDKGSVDRALKHFEMWNQNREVIIMGVDYDDEEVLQAARQVSGESLAKFEKEMKGLLEEAFREADGYIQEAERLSAEAAIHSSIGVLVSIFIASLIAFLLIRSTNRQLGADPRALRQVADSIASGDLSTNGVGDKPVTGVMASMNTMRDTLDKQLSTERQAARENNRVKQALDNVSSNVVVVNADMQVMYLNDACGKLLRRWQQNLQESLPEFDAHKLLNGSIDMLGAQFASIKQLNQKSVDQLVFDVAFGDCHWQVTASTVNDAGGEQIGCVLELGDRSEQKLIEEEIQNIVDNAKVGDLAQRIDLSDKKEFFERLSRSINEFVDVNEKIIADSVQAIGAIADGDLTVPVATHYQGSFGQLATGINQTIETLTQVMADITGSAQHVLSDSQDIRQGNQNLSSRTEEQAQSLVRTTASVEQMTTTVRANAQSARRANELASSARDIATDGGGVVNQAITAMQEISQSSTKIVDIISVIDEIAFQTNLLALNAAVEAARAGEQGRGFAVVAKEVGNLAGRSAVAAKEIKGLIEDSAVKVEEGARLVDQSGNTLETIVKSVKQVSDIVSTIAKASLDQTDGIEQINLAITQMDEMTQQNAGMVHEASGASTSLGEQAYSLNQIVSKFSFRDDAGMPELPSPALRVAS